MKELDIQNHGNILPCTRKDLISWIRTRLKRYNIKLRKRLSQIILIDPKILTFIAEKIGKIIEDRSNVAILEIGAGVGNLTMFLGCKNSNALVIAIEIDNRFASILKEIKNLCSNIEIIIGDALNLIKSFRGIDLVVGNIPYHITSDILLTLAKSNTKYALLTIQRDVADRLVSKPGTKNYGKLSILMQILFEINIMRIIPSTLFRPKPQVSSAIILLRRKKEYNEYMKNVEELTKCLFSYKRKLVLKAFTYCIDKNKRLEKKIKMEDNIWRKRVLQLAVEDIMNLTNIYVELKKKN